MAALQALSRGTVLANEHSIILKHPSMPSLRCKGCKDADLSNRGTGFMHVINAISCSTNQTNLSNLPSLPSPSTLICKDLLHGHLKHPEERKKFDVEDIQTARHNQASTKTQPRCKNTYSSSAMGTHTCNYACVNQANQAAVAISAL